MKISKYLILQAVFSNKDSDLIDSSTCFIKNVSVFAFKSPNF